MEENNFETIINTWRRLSGEQVTEPTLPSMSGESPDFPEAHSSHRKKEEEAIVPAVSDSKQSIGVGPSFSSSTVADVPIVEKKEGIAKDSDGKGDGKDKSDEQECFMKADRDSSKDSDSDGNESDEKDYLNNDDKLDDDKDKDSKSDKSKKHKNIDKVDSIYLRPPPPHKSRSTRSSAQDEDGCGIKCLYYTLQCCDCVLM